MRSNKGKGRGCNRYESDIDVVSDSVSNNTPEKPKPRHLARTRRDEKIRICGPRSQGMPIVYGRDITIGSDDNERGHLHTQKSESGGVKRKSVAHAKHHLEMLKQRAETFGVRPRSLKRAERKVEFALDAEQVRIERANGKTLA